MIDLAKARVLTALAGAVAISGAAAGVAPAAAHPPANAAARRFSLRATPSASAGFYRSKKGDLMVAVTASNVTPGSRHSIVIQRGSCASGPAAGTGQISETVARADAHGHIHATIDTRRRAAALTRRRLVLTVREGVVARHRARAKGLAVQDLACGSLPRRIGRRVHRLRLRMISPSHKPTGAQPTSGSPQPVGIPGTWKPVFDDEFDTSALDTSKWSTGWHATGVTPPVNSDEQECYSPSQVTVGGGALNLSAISHPLSCGGTQRPYASGMVISDGHFQFTYGTMEARIWMPGGGSTISDWPAFWADGQDWPTDGEIDAVEGLRGKPCYHFHYPGGGPGGCASVNGAAAGWHTYAADWEPGSITFYYDGEVVGRQTAGVTSAPMYLILNLALSSSVSPPDVVPATMRVDYVRVWQH